MDDPNVSFASIDDLDNLFLATEIANVLVFLSPFLDFRHGFKWAPEPGGLAPLSLRSTGGDPNLTVNC